MAPGWFAMQILWPPRPEAPVIYPQPAAQRFYPGVSAGLGKVQDESGCVVDGRGTGRAGPRRPPGAYPHGPSSTRRTEGYSEVQVKTDGQILNEFGESFQLRSPKELKDGPAAQARQVRSAPSEEHPLVDEPSVTLRIFYDDKPVEVKFQNGEALISEPREGQNVVMKIERLDKGSQALGAVLKVNGENTIFRERKPDLSCPKWVLHPGAPATRVVGFQADTIGASSGPCLCLPFEVRSP
jgi:hypothetical protein